MFARAVLRRRALFAVAGTTAGSVAWCSSSSRENRLKQGFEAEIDSVAHQALKEGLPGVVVYARRGGDVFHKAYGQANVEANKPMETDAMFRMYSMTKVLASCVTLMLKEKGALDLNDPVSKYIPSFDTDWHIVRSATSSAEVAGTVKTRDMLGGEELTLKYETTPATEVMTIKHLMAEHSGLGYDIWGHLDQKVLSAFV
jgi:CubicO group peptidase (beta-lactamase class C family)